MIALGGVTAFVSMTRFPLVIWDPENFALSPSNFSVQIDLGTLAPLPTDTFGWPAAVAILVTLIGGALLALGFNVLREQTDERFSTRTVPRRCWARATSCSCLRA